MDKYYQDITIKYEDRRRGLIATVIRMVHILHIDYSEESFIRIHIIKNVNNEIIYIPKLPYLSITVD